MIYLQGFNLNLRLELQVFTDKLTFDHLNYVTNKYIPNIPTLFHIKSQVAGNFFTRLQSNHLSISPMHISIKCKLSQSKYQPYMEHITA